MWARAATGSGKPLNGLIGRCFAEVSWIIRRYKEGPAGGRTGRPPLVGANLGLLSANRRMRVIACP